MIWFFALTGGYLLGTVPLAPGITYFFRLETRTLYISPYVLLKTEGKWPFFAISGLFFLWPILGFMLVKFITGVDDVSLGAATAVTIGQLWPVFAKNKKQATVFPLLGLLLLVSPFAGLGLVVAGFLLFSYWRQPARVTLWLALVSPVVMYLFQPEVRYVLMLFGPVFLLLWQMRATLLALFDSDEEKMTEIFPSWR